MCDEQINRSEPKIDESPNINGKVPSIFAPSNKTAGPSRKAPSDLERLLDPLRVLLLLQAVNNICI